MKTASSWYKSKHASSVAKLSISRSNRSSGSQEKRSPTFRIILCETGFPRTIATNATHCSTDSCWMWHGSRFPVDAIGCLSIKRGYIGDDSSCNGCMLVYIAYDPKLFNRDFIFSSSGPSVVIPTQVLHSNLRTRLRRGEDLQIGELPLKRAWFQRNRVTNHTGNSHLRDTIPPFMKFGRTIFYLSHKTQI